MQIATLGAMLIIGVMVSGCTSKHDVAKVPQQVTARTKEVCDVPLSYRVLKDAPAKPVAVSGAEYPTNEQMDIYWKTDIAVGQICELICRMRDILFICTYGQDKLVNAPRQCLDAQGRLKCN